MEKLEYDAVIAGCGVAGLYTALHLGADKQIMFSKEIWKAVISCSHKAASCVLLDEDDYDTYFEDTMRAGHYENRKESVDIMLRGSRAVIDETARAWRAFRKKS